MLALTPGDPAGIGPEITWKALKSGIARKLGIPILCIGARAPFERLGARVLEADPNELRPPPEKRPHVWLLPAPVQAPRAGILLPGYQSGWAIERATTLVQQSRARALVTGPISKERLKLGGFNYPGHTEFLAELCDAAEVTMMLANDQLRVSLVTTHLAIGKVPGALTRAGISRAIDQTARGLQMGWGIRRPKLAICGLNPHAGENGLFGLEERRIIAPALRGFAQRRDLEVYGPLPADTLFARHTLAHARDRFDAVICMYHDQGLIPVKLLDFKNTVNVTLGLPIIRTSVDHGVGFDIAGRGVADPSSMLAAIHLAAHMARKRGKIHGA